jgi:hypothetical protein
MQAGGQNIDVRGVTQGFGAAAEIPHAAALVEFADAVVRRDVPHTAHAGAGLRRALGDAAFVDAAAIVAAFHGFVRIADAIGIPYTTAARGQDAPDIRERVGVNEFPRVRQDAGHLEAPRP